MSQTISQTLKELYTKFDQLYSGIFDAVCTNCKDHDCEGYVWLLPEEADTLIDADVTVVELNGNTNFIHSFPKVDESLRLDIMKPPCVLHKDKKCSIYPIRPLVCRIYPAGLIIQDKQVVVVLYHDCEFVRRLAGDVKNDFILRIKTIFEELPTEFISELVNAYLKVDEVSFLPEGPNAYNVLFPLKNCNKEESCHVEV